MDAFDVFEDQKRFNEITDAWIAGKITGEQLVKAE